MNFNVLNAVDNSTTIDILGDIGEGWFDEGITMQSINEQLNSIDSNNIVLNISSLGGDLIHALTIYDLLRNHKANITAKIMGATASSGTVIAMAANKIEMSDNSLFLVHRASSFAGGNSEDLREQAEALDKFDDRIVNIYKKKTNKRKSQIMSLMEEDKWIDATEAKSFGFIDKVFNGDKVLNKAVIDKINNSYLPKINNSLKIIKMNKDFKNIMSLMDVEGIEITDESASFSLDTIKAIDKKLEVDNSHLVAEHNEAIKNLGIANIKIVDDAKLVSDKAISDLEAKSKEDLKAEIKKVTDLQAKYDTYVSENPAKSSKNDSGTSDPDPSGTPKESLGIKELFNDSQKRNLNNNIKK